MKLRLLCLLHILCVALLGQSAPKQTSPAVAAPPSPGVTLSESYPFPLEERDKIRDLQHESDQLEIENQKMLVKLEQNKARQSADIDQIKLLAYQFASSRKLDLDLFELDPAQIRFVKKSKKP